MMIGVVLAAMTVGGAALAADVAAQIQARQAGMKAIGGATKGLGDGLASGKSAADLKPFALRIAQLAPQTGGWFPAGTGPSSGVKTKAKADIWTKPAEFQKAREAFVAQSAKLKAAADSGNADAIKAEFGALRGTCKSCHEQFQDKG